MATYTDQELLDAVREAIRDAVVAGSATLTIHGRTIGRHSLDELHRLETYYAQRVDGASARRPAVGAFRKPGGSTRLASSDT